MTDIYNNWLNTNLIKGSFLLFKRVRVGGILNYFVKEIP